MKFTCIMPTFNDAALIRQSINSVLNQSFEDFQLLVVDDGSDSETKAILNEFDDPRLTVLPQANDGVSAARNRALHHARGDYVCFLDADDTKAPWALAEAAELIDAKEPDLVIVTGALSEAHSTIVPFMDTLQMDGYYRERESLGQGDTLSIRKAWASAMEPQPANKYIKRDVITRSGLHFPHDHFFEDFFFHVMSVAHAESIEMLNSCNYTYFQRVMRTQTTGSNGAIRFDILGTTRVTFQLFQMHPDFDNPRQRGAVFLSGLRLLRWCEERIPVYHKYAYRLTLREILRVIDPLYFLLPDDTPDPRGEKDGLLAYAQEVKQ